VPYHLDEYLPSLDLPLPADEVITAELAPGGTWQRLAVLYNLVAEAVARVAGQPGGCPVVVSGCCITALGTVAGLQHAGIDPAVVWFDAHGDVQTVETTTSGYLAGMSLRVLAGYRPELVAEGLGLRPVPEDRITLVGARDLDPPEAEYLARAAIGRAEVATLTPAAVPEGPLYVHLDADVIDPPDLPGLRFPAPGGPSAAEVSAALGALLATGRVAALGLACSWHPGRETAARFAADLRTALASLS
jgi:arginase